MNKKKKQIQLKWKQLKVIMKIFKNKKSKKQQKAAKIFRLVYFQKK